MSNQFKEGDLIEWQTGRPAETFRGIIISCREMTSHLHHPGKKGVTSGTMLEVLFEGAPIWISANQCRIISE